MASPPEMGSLSRPRLSSARGNASDAFFPDEVINQSLSCKLTAPKQSLPAKSRCR